MPKAKTPKKKRKVSTVCKCETCKNYRKPNAVSRAIASLEPIRNPYPSHDTATLQRLLTRNFEYVKEKAIIPGGDVNNIYGAIDRAVMRLSWYCGPEDDAAFQAWIGPIVRIEADRLRLYNAMLVHEKTVLKSISTITKHCADLGADLGETTKYGFRFSETVGEIAADVWIRLFADPWEFDTPGYAKHPDRKPATLRGRLWRFGHYAALAWRKKQIRERDKERKGRSKTVSPDDYETESKEQEITQHLLENGKLANQPIVLGPHDEWAYEKPATSKDFPAPAA
jgi:hypothetical protein